MNLFVLMKRTFDTEEKIVIDAGKIQDDGAEWIINPYDEYAIEEAIQLKENTAAPSPLLLSAAKKRKRSCVQRLPWDVTKPF